MKGIPNKNNFYVFNVSTNKKKEFRTLSDVARKYNINYYTARELNRLTENDTEKLFYIINYPQYLIRLKYIQ